MQRGVFSTDTLPYLTPITINISPVDPSKCLCVLNSAANYNNYGAGILAEVVLNAINVNNIIIARRGANVNESGDYVEISWQVIEFY